MSAAPVLKPISGRVRYNVARAAATETRRRAMAANLGPLELKVLVVVLEFTVAYQKLIDSTSARQVAARVYGTDADSLKSGQRQRVTEALHSLGQKGVIGYENSRGKWSVPNLWIGGPVNDAPLDDIDEEGWFQRHPTADSTSSDGGSNVTPLRGNTKTYLDI